MKGQDFITAAGKLAAFAGRDEALLRSAVSRAYYGAFHVALEFLHDLGFALHRNANAHSVAQRLLIGSNHSQAAAAGGLLAALHSDRIRADYHLGDQRFSSFEKARVRIEMADRMRALIEQCRKEPTRAEVIEAIAAYQQRVE